MDQDTNLVVEVQIVDKGEVDLKSVPIEKVGLKRALTNLCSRLQIAEFVTDESTTIIAMMGKYTIT